MCDVCEGNSDVNKDCDVNSEPDFACDLMRCFALL